MKIAQHQSMYDTWMYSLSFVPVIARVAGLHIVPKNYVDVVQKRNASLSGAESRLPVFALLDSARSSLVACRSGYQRLCQNLVRIQNRIVIN